MPLNLMETSNSEQQLEWELELLSHKSKKIKKVKP